MCGLFSNFISIQGALLDIAVSSSLWSASTTGAVRILSCYKIMASPRAHLFGDTLRDELHHTGAATGKPGFEFFIPAPKLWRGALGALHEEEL